MKKPTYEELEKKLELLKRHEKNLGVFQANDICHRISVPVMIARRDGSIIDFNTALVDLTGVSDSEINNLSNLRSFFDLLQLENGEPRNAFDTFFMLNGDKHKERTRDCVIMSKGRERRYVKLAIYTVAATSDSEELLLLQFIDNTDLMNTINRAKEYEEHYKSLFNRSFDLIYIHDFEGRFIDANPAALQFFGYTWNEITSLTFASILGRDQIPSAFKVLEEIRANGYQSGLSEYEMTTKKGTVIYVETNGTLIYRDNKPFAILGIGRNVTERKRTETLEHSFVEKLKFLATSAMDFVQLSPDDDMYMAIGQKLRKIAGNTIISINAFDYKTDTLEVKTVLGIEKYTETIMKMLGNHPVGMTFTLTEKQKEPIRTGKLTKIDGGVFALLFGSVSKTICSILETMLNIGDIYGIGFVNKGSIYGVTTLLTFKNSPPLDGELVETFINQASVALQRWLAIKAVHESEEKYHSLTESINDVIYSLNSEGIVEYIGPQITQYGYRPNDVLGHNFIDLVAPEDYEKIITYLNKTMTTGYLIPIEFRVIDKNGDINWVENNGSVQHDIDGKTLWINGVLRDITERVKAEQALMLSEVELRKQKEALEQKNIALGEIIEQIEFEKNRIREDVVSNIEKTILPILDKIKMSENPTDYVDFLKQALNNVTSRFGRTITQQTFNLTPREIEICTMVENGLTNKEISHLLGISCRTVENHRKKIRKKLDITNKSTNLSSFLKYIQT